MVIKAQLEKYFFELTGFSAFNFQKALGAIMLQGKNVIMQAPTGAGKTFASILPFIVAKAENLSFPRKMIYSLPMRVLANSLYQTVSENKFINELGLKVTLQTGEHPSDPLLLEGDIIFTTIDQSISSLLSIPLSLPKRQANINVGALIGSYLVFDEFHLLEPDKSLATLFHLLRLLNGYSPFCLMTATLSERLLKEFAKETNAEIVDVSQEEISKIPSQRNKQRIIETKNCFLESQFVAEEHRDRTIVICNRVSRCQDIYLEIKKIKESDSELGKRLKDTELICIHARFFGRDRQKKEKSTLELFKKDSEANAILIATQVIEVGIDITCDTMHTEISPINSLLQRIGRCARFENETGKVFVYNVGIHLPYNKELIENTFEELKRRDKINMDYLSGQQVIDAVLTNKEMSELNGILASNRLEEIKNSWIKCEKSAAHHLIREIDSISLILTNNPNLYENPYSFESLSIYRYTLISEVKKLEEKSQFDWIVRKIEEESNFIEDLQNEFNYSPLSSTQLKTEQFVIANANAINYDLEVGLNFLGIGNDCSKRISKDSTDKKFVITKDTYEEHISFLIEGYRKYFKVKNDYFFEKLKSKLGIEIDFEEMINFMIVLHDYGKLNKEWQRKAKESQRQKEYISDDVILAHTDYDSKTDSRIVFPPHAGAGALVVLFLLERSNPIKKLKDKIVTMLSKAIATAIMRHHSPLANDVTQYYLIQNGIKEIEQLLKVNAKNFLPIEKENQILLTYHNDNISDYMVSYHYENLDLIETILYFYFVRILRICDQKSFEIKEESKR
ncbi:MAG: CRISPR-associated helicase Cas3' [Ignavibacteriaceae bacterium]|nr:CRISPR-associated helicase Cas3' [Ignavibacteriaceae bacterium]